jgi:hypothetical protein
VLTLLTSKRSLLGQLDFTSFNTQSETFDQGLRHLASRRLDDTAKGLA